MANSSTGDSYIRWALDSQNYAFGVDNSDSNLLKFTSNGASTATPSVGTELMAFSNTGIGLFATTPVGQASAMTTQLTQITFVDENTPDFSMSSLTTTSAAGFATLDEAQAFVEVVANLQTRVQELEAMLDTSPGIGIAV